MAVLENKKQLFMLVGAVAAGIVAAVMIAGWLSASVNEQTQILALKYEKAQKEKEQQYNQQMAMMNQKIADVEAKAKQAAEQAAQQAAAAAQARADAEKKAEAAKKAQPSLALRTPTGKRAITVQIDSLQAVGGLLSPGDYVDVIAHLDIPSDADETKKSPVTAMIFQKLQVLAVNAIIDQPGVYDEQQKQKTIKLTFAVDPQEAGLLAFAEKNGKLELALRGPNETRRQMVSAATWSTLAEYVLENQGADIQAAVKKTEAPKEETLVQVEKTTPEEAKPYIQIFRGGKEL